MAHAKHILVADNTSEKPSNITFLLRLAGYRVSEFADELEACNWLLQNDPGLPPADMLLLNEPKPERSLLALLFQLRQRLPELELLLVTPKTLELQGQINGLSPPVHQCTSGELHHMIRRIFQKENPLPVTQAPHQSTLTTSGTDRTKKCPIITDLETS